MYQILEIVGVWFGAFATFAAVVLALFLQNISERRQIPKLLVEYDSASAGDNRYLSPSATAGVGAEREELWVRVRVTNKSRKQAKDVELRFINSVLQNDGHGYDRPHWWFKVSSVNAISVTIPPFFTQYFDIAYLAYEKESQCFSSYLVIVKPVREDWIKEKETIEKRNYNSIEIGSKYIISFAIVGENCDSTYYRMPIQICPPRQRPLHPQLAEVHMRECVVASSPFQITAAEAFSETVRNDAPISKMLRKLISARK